MPKCKYCEKDFNRERDTKKFCSPKCRVYWNRNKKISVTHGEFDERTEGRDSETDLR